MKKPIEKSKKMVRMLTSVPVEVKARAQKNADDDPELKGNLSAWQRRLIENNV